VRVAPSAGFNAFSFRVPHGDGTLQVLVEPESDQELQAGGFGFGCPILFPFPNRTRGGHYTFNGQSHQLDVNWKDGHAIHGLVNDVPWAVQETGASDEQGAWVSASINIDDHPEMLRQYPFPCTLSVTYRQHRRRGAADGFRHTPLVPLPLDRAGET
jgi:aldose 1-epimerase